MSSVIELSKIPEAALFKAGKEKETRRREDKMCRAPLMRG